MSNLRNKKKAFTLVEVIIVLAIIAIIAAIAIPNLTKVRQESKKKADIQSMENISRTINMLVTDETIPYNGEETLIEITYSGTVQTVVVEIDGTANDTVATAVQEYISDVKKPQVEGQTSYEIAISATGDITVFTIGDVRMNQSGVSSAIPPVTPPDSENPSGD